MIKIMDPDDPGRIKELTGTKFLLAGNIDGELLRESELIPLDVGAGLVQQAVPIGELGKQLLRASGEGNIDEIRLLMGKGAPFTADWLGTSPLHLAAQNNHLEVCEILLRAGIHKDAITKVARTPLHMASYEGNIDIVECLLKHGADYECRDMLEMTPLHWAAQNGHADVVSLLVRYGASTNPVNKFELRPADLALQIKRQDIMDIINAGVRDPLIATQHLQLEMASDSNDTVDISEMQDDVNYIPIVDIDDGEKDIETEQLNDTQDAEMDEDVESLDVVGQPNHSLSESIKYLQNHGITMLPAEDNSILSTVMESGHCVVLTEAGKQALNSIKQADNVPILPRASAKLSLPKDTTVTPLNSKKIITVTPEEFLAMTTNGALKQVNNRTVTLPKHNVKRIVMKKNKTTPITTTLNVPKVWKPPELSSDVDTLRKQLLEAYRTIEEYKVKLRKKSVEADFYKQQMQLLLN